MSNILQTLKLNWEEVGKLAGQVISAALKREVTCHAGYDDYDYWAVWIRQEGSAMRIWTRS